MTAMIILIIVLLLVLFFIIFGWYVSVSNDINQILVKIEEADSGIDVALTKRYDVLTKMVEIVKSYVNYESETFVKTINLRKNIPLNEKNEINKKMNKEFEKIQVVAENYPELKSSENYKTLQNAILDVEEHLQASRRAYNSNVSIYNQMLVTFPKSLVAKSKSMIKKEFFEVDDMKKDVSINL